MIEKIDFVVTWVDGNDPVWKKVKPCLQQIVRIKS